MPTVEERIAAMKRCADCGYPVRAVIMPVIPMEGWKDCYCGFIQRLLREVPLSRLTFGGICIYKGARQLMERKLSGSNVITDRIRGSGKSEDGRVRYSRPFRVSVYRRLIQVVREVRPDLELALCLEEPEVWQAVKLEDRMGRCNCVL